jgi:hypothetical protein
MPASATTSVNSIPWTVTRTSSRPRISTFNFELSTFSPLTPLQSILTRIRPRNSFRIHTYISKGLKVSWNQYLRKVPGVGGLNASSTFDFELSTFDSLTPVCPSVMRNCVRNSFRPTSYISKGLKVLYSHQLQEQGVGVLLFPSRRHLNAPAFQPFRGSHSTLDFQLSTR